MKDEIRFKLRNGVSIDKICTDYHLTFPDLMDLMGNGENIRGVKKRPNDLLYIYQTPKGSYYIKNTNGHYGTYHSLTDAKKVRDYFIFNGWNKRRLDKVCEKLGVERIQKEEIK